MGRVRFSITVLLLTAVLCAVSFFTLEKKTQHIIGLIDNVQSLADSGDIEGTKRAVEILSSEWESYQTAASIFVRNEKLSDVQGSMTRLMPLLRHGSEELDAELEKARSGLEWIVESEVPRISNIL